MLLRTSVLSHATFILLPSCSPLSPQLKIWYETLPTVNDIRGIWIWRWCPYEIILADFNLAVSTLTTKLPNLIPRQIFWLYGMFFYELWCCNGILMLLYFWVVLCPTPHSSCKEKGSGVTCPNPNFWDFTTCHLCPGYFKNHLTRQKHWSLRSSLPNLWSGWNAMNLLTIFPWF